MLNANYQEPSSLWAKCRRVDLVEHNGWVPDGYVTCRKGRSAWDAAYSRSAEIEAVMLQGLTYSGGEGDLEKCYDLAIPEMAVLAAMALGVPKIIALTELAFLRSAVYAFRYAGGFGSFYEHIRGLMQGSPLSEFWIGALLLPWYEGVRDMGAIPRVLADDFSYVCFGDDRDALDATVERAMLLTIQYVDGISGSMAISKSALFSPSPELSLMTFNSASAGLLCSFTAWTALLCGARSSSMDAVCAHTVSRNC